VFVFVFVFVLVLVLLLRHTSADGPTTMADLTEEATGDAAADAARGPGPEQPKPVPTRETSDNSFGGDGFMMGGSIGDGALPEDIQHQQLLQAQQLGQPAVPRTPGHRSHPTPVNTPHDASMPNPRPGLSNAQVPPLPQLHGVDGEQNAQMPLSSGDATSGSGAAGVGGGSYAARSAVLMERHDQRPQTQPTIVVSPAARPASNLFGSAAAPITSETQADGRGWQHSHQASNIPSASMPVASMYQPTQSSSAIASSPTSHSSALSYAQRSQAIVQSQSQVAPAVQQQVLLDAARQRHGAQTQQNALSPPQQGIMSRYAQDVVHDPQSRVHQNPQVHVQGQGQSPQRPNVAMPQTAAPSLSTVALRGSSGGGSYAARSAALNSSQTQQNHRQQQQQHPQQPFQPTDSHSTMSGTMYGDTKIPHAKKHDEYPTPEAQNFHRADYLVHEHNMPHMQNRSSQVQVHPSSHPKPRVQPSPQFGMSAQQQHHHQHQHQHQQQQQYRVPHHLMGQESPAEQAQQSRLLTDATRKVQEHAYYMKQAMERQDLPTVLDRAASMVGELGEHAHAHHNSPSSVPPLSGSSNAGERRPTLNPKNYYELHLRALDDLPTLEDYLKNLAGQSKITVEGNVDNSVQYTMRQLYDIVQYCPNVLSRLYLQICAAGALISSNDVGAKWVMNDVMQAVKCVQNPVRGLFLRHYLLQAFRDKLPDTPLPVDARDDEGGNVQPDSKPSARALPHVVSETEVGNVKDSYEFILSNFTEMNKLWVRIQNLPGDGKSKEMRRRRERERNELRILVGTNLIRLSQLECVTSKIYGERILPKILEHIVACNDPLAQAYLMDCITQVFPDEYHIETMPILLGVCPRLRDKVNIRTILQCLMDRLATYLADEELLDEQDTNDVKSNLARESFGMFDECVQKVYNARGPKLSAKEAIRLQTALLSFTMKCHQGNREQIVQTLGACVRALNQARTTFSVTPDGSMSTSVSSAPLDDAATKDLEKLLSIPMNALALGVLQLDHFADLIAFLPWTNRRQVALALLESVNAAGKPPQSIDEIEELFEVITPVMRDETMTQQQIQHGQTNRLMAGLSVGNGAPESQLLSSTQQHPMSQPNPLGTGELRKHNSLVAKLILLLDHDNTDMMFEMLSVAKRFLCLGGPQRTCQTYIALVHASLNLVVRIVKIEHGSRELNSNTGRIHSSTCDDGNGATASSKESSNQSGGNGQESSGGTVADHSASLALDKDPVVDIQHEESQACRTEAKPDEKEVNPSNTGNADSENVNENEGDDTASRFVGARNVFVFIQQTITALAAHHPESAIKLFHESARLANSLIDMNGVTCRDQFSPIINELFVQSLALYEEKPGDFKYQTRCILSMTATLTYCHGLEKEDYEKLAMRVTTYAAKTLRKEDQCRLVTICSNLFFAVDASSGGVHRSNPARCLECLQRALKLADACTASHAANIGLFVDLLEQYLFFFGKNNPSISAKYITGLLALVNEHTSNRGGNGDTAAVVSAKAQFSATVKLIKNLQASEETGNRYKAISLGGL